MQNWSQYYKNVKVENPNSNVRELIENIKVKPGKAIDLGCGRGRDSIYLLKHNWKVISIDKNDTSETILEKLTKQQKERHQFIKQDFKDIEFTKCDLFLTNFAIHFSNEQEFNNLWKKIYNSINKGGYFAGTFLGEKDSWNTKKENMIFFNKNEILKLFENYNIITIKEIEREGSAFEEKNKHWHIFDIIAKKV